MGTNYYLIPKPACTHCDRVETEGLHIGKSSGGWCFSLHVYPEGTPLWEGSNSQYKIRDLPDWLPLFNLGIVDEYKVIISPDQLLEVILGREKWTAGSVLRRHEIDQRHCIGHGAGSYDLLIGAFS